MGLDMYLKRKKKSCKRTIEEICNGDYEEYKRDLKETVYWRKANMIHKWFVDNVQDGNDNCEFYLVSKEKIEELKNICNEILKNINLIDGKIVNGETLKDGKWVKNYEDGKIIDNAEICERLLPTQQGFFFGSYEYDEYYYENIKYTRDKLEFVLDMIDFDEYDLYYGSSW